MTRRLLLATVLVTTIACGLKNDPLAPQLVQPDPPGNLAVASVAEGVRVSWRRPNRYSGGGKMNDLAYVAVERAPGEGAAPVFTEVGRVTVVDRERFRQERRTTWVDTNAPVGSRFLYRAIAVTLDDYYSKPAGPVAITVGQAEPEKPQD
ncbi:MAG TPA: hypothetical protein VGR62_21920 [Candidatus Binatia bacterium]|jgi:hypothetical protein|nr:hypothetical protein [Candidatus Binatia bacterium]